jgi:DNA repair protein RadC
MKPNEPTTVNPHSGHRARVKRKYADFGLDVFAEHEVLELILFFAIPRGDVNVTAHALLAKFNSLDGVLNAQISELQNVPGIGLNAALLISLFEPVRRKSQILLTSSNARLKNSRAVAEYLIPYFLGSKLEEFYILTLSASARIIKCKKLQSGSVTDVNIDMRSILAAAIEDNAAGVIVAHNHPSETASASKNDVTATGQMANALRLIGVHLIDHIIVAGTEYFSMKEHGMM